MCRVRAAPRPTVGPVPVSSLVFVVIVAIWAAYLVQHWARRREDAAATRSMEDFSEAMRVLEKRPALPTTELSTPRPHSYAVKPASAGRTVVDVKRAVPAGASRRSSPLVARHGHAVHSVPVARPAGGSPSRHADHDPYAEVDRMPQTARPTSVPVSRRRLRAAVLLLALLWLPTAVVLTLTHVLMWVSVPFAVLTIAAVLVWLRAEARGDRLRSASRTSVDSARAHEYSGRPAAEHRRERGHRHDMRRPAVLPVVSVEDTQVIRSSVVSLEPATASVLNPAPQGAPAAAAAHAAPARPAVHAVFDVQALATGPVAVVAEPAAPAPEGSWSPVPVPPPTYVLKAKAEPRWTDSGIPADVFDTPEFAEEADELDDRALFARRAVSQ